MNHDDHRPTSFPPPGSPAGSQFDLPAGPPTAPPSYARPPHAPQDDGWNRAGWDMEDLQKYGNRGAASRGHRHHHHEARPTPWLTFVTILSGLFVLTGGFNCFYNILMLVTGHSEDPIFTGVGTLISAAITWAYYNVAMHKHSGRKTAIGLGVLQLVGSAFGFLGVFVIGFFSIPFASALGAILFLNTALNATYLYALQRHDVAVHFTH